MPTILKICSEKIKLGERRLVHVEVGHLYDFTEMNIPVQVIRGIEDGPILFVSATIHGDEINGSEIVRRLIKKVDAKKLKGTLIAVPVVNVFGFNNRSRYLPDRRDLNRCFPGSSKSSLAAQMAHVFMKEIVAKSTHGIDLHTGAIHRYNLPQIRACLDDRQTKKMADAFGAIVNIHSKLRDGSLREAARKKGVPMLLFEGGEALRFDESVIKIAVKGCLNVMNSIGMLSMTKESRQRQKAVTADSSLWVRAPHGGSVRVFKKVGAIVEKGEKMAVVQDLFGDVKIDVVSPEKGIIVGASRLPLVNKGDALFHLANLDKSQSAKIKAEREHYEDHLINED